MIKEGDWVLVERSARSDLIGNVYLVIHVGRSGDIITLDNVKGYRYGYSISTCKCHKVEDKELEILQWVCDERNRMNA